MLQVGAILAILFTVFQAWAQDDPERFAVAGVTEFTAAYEAWDGDRFGVAIELLRQATTNAPTNGTCFYWLGTAQFHRMLQLQHSAGSETNKKAIATALDASVNALKVAVKLNETDAESHALLGTLYGMKINGNLFRAARLGPRVVKHQKQALKHGADNPRVQYLLGTCQFHTARKPDAWSDALKTFQKADKLFEIEATSVAGPLEPRWGHAPCLTFIGRTHEKLGQPTEAAAYFRKALEMHPQDSVAREGLQRVIEKK